MISGFHICLHNKWRVVRKADFYPGIDFYVDWYFAFVQTDATSFQAEILTNIIMLLAIAILSHEYSNAPFICYFVLWRTGQTLTKILSLKISYELASLANLYRMCFAMVH